MKIRPVTRFRPPNYPSLEQAREDPRLLEAVPRRWTVSPVLAYALGVGLLARPEDTQAREAAVPKIENIGFFGSGQRPKPETPASAAVQPSCAWVAAVLADALEQDGRGGFGCVAVNPPVVLPEDEAIDIIRAELQAAGLELEQDVEVENILNPLSRLSGNEQNVDRELTARFNADKEGEFFHRDKIFIGRTKATFDLADSKRSIYIEYLSMKDYVNWMGHENSTASYYDFPKLVPLVAEALGKRAAGKPEAYGIFFDPLAHSPEPPSGRMQGLNPEQQRLVRTERGMEYARLAGSLPERSREKLRDQVRFFVKQLRERGVIPSPQP